MHGVARQLDAECETPCASLLLILESLRDLVYSNTPGIAVMHRLQLQPTNLNLTALSRVVRQVVVGAGSIRQQLTVVNMDPFGSPVAGGKATAFPRFIKTVLPSGMER